MFTFKDDEMRVEALSRLTYVFLIECPFFLIKREYIMCVRFYQRQTIYTSFELLQYKMYQLYDNWVCICFLITKQFR